MSQPIHQEVIVVASSERIYRALTDGREFGKFSGAAAEIDASPGGAFSCFDGMITGRNVELEPGELIVQAWRVKTWQPGVYSIVKFELRQEGSATRVVIDHTGFPAEHREHLEIGWKSKYWEPLRKYLAAPKG